MEQDKKYKVPALEKSIAIIEALASSEMPLGVSEICKMLDIPKTSAFFILNTLDQHQYIAKTDDGKYRLSNKFITIGLALLNRLDLRSVAKPYMKKLLSDTGFTVHLAILDNGDAMIIEKVENDAYVKFSTYIGQRLDLHASGVGKALACYIPEKQLDSILSKKGMPSKTVNTITSLKEFKESVEASRKQGYTIEDEEDELGIRCIGAPILGFDNVLKGSISITALRSELPIQEIPMAGKKVKEIAEQISKELGYSTF